MKENRKKLFVLSIFLVILIIGGAVNSIDENELEQNGIATKGKVIKYNFCNNNWCGKYKFYVDGKAYYGTWSGGYFKCPSGKEGCLGQEFTITYSSLDPNLNEINLEKFNDKKTVK